MAAPRVIGAAARRWLERAPEIRLREGSDVSGDAQFNRRVVKSLHCLAQLRVEIDVCGKLIIVSVEAAERAKENLPLEAKRIARGDNLRDLLHLIAETRVRENRLQRRGAFEGGTQDFAIADGLRREIARAIDERCIAVSREQLLHGVVARGDDSVSAFLIETLQAECLIGRERNRIRLHAVGENACARHRDDHRKRCRAVQAFGAVGGASSPTRRGWAGGDRSLPLRLLIRV